MLIKKFFLNILEYIKKAYFWLFNFMLGTHTKKSIRFEVHCATIMLYLFSFVYYYNLIIQLFQMEGIFAIERLGSRIGNVIMALIAPLVFACMVKLVLLITKKCREINKRTYVRAKTTGY